VPVFCPSFDHAPPGAPPGAGAPGAPPLGAPPLDAEVPGAMDASGCGDAGLRVDVEAGRRYTDLMGMQLERMTLLEPIRLTRSTAWEMMLSTKSLATRRRDALDA